MADKFNVETDNLEALWQEFSKLGKMADSSKELDTAVVEPLIARGRDAVAKHQKNHKVAMALIKANEPKAPKKPKTTRRA